PGVAGRVDGDAERLAALDRLALGDDPGVGDAGRVALRRLGEPDRTVGGGRDALRADAGQREFGQRVRRRVEPADALLGEELGEPDAAVARDGDLTGHAALRRRRRGRLG